MKTIIIILATTIICIGFSSILLAQEKGGLSTLVAVSKEAKTELKTATTIAIFLSGNEPLLTRIIEDALAIYLNNADFTIINRDMLEKSVGEQAAKMKKEKEEGAINALDIGKAVNSNFILTGTVIIESSEGKSALVKIASFQLVDVKIGKTLISILFESEKGKSFSETAKGFVDILRQHME